MNDMWNMVHPLQPDTIQQKRGISTCICYNMETLQKHYARWKKPDAKHHTLQLHEILRKVKSTQTESRLVFTCSGRWERKVTANGHKRPSGDVRNVLKLGYSHGCIIQ